MAKIASIVPEVGDVIYESYMAGIPLLVVEVKERSYVCKTVNGDTKILSRYWTSRGPLGSSEHEVKYSSYVDLCEQNERKANNMREKLNKLLAIEISTPS
jgi:hypothetical protein